MSKILQRILSELDSDGHGLIDKLQALSPSDFNSFMLEVYQSKVDRMQPSEMLSNFANNRFAAPSEIDPVTYHRFEADILALAKQQEITPVLLSPVAPLGNCSVYGTVDQKKVVSATRGTEVLSDPTNMLATIIADKIKREEFDNRKGVHCCATSRVTRAQFFSGANFFAHFGVYGIVSSGKDRGSYQCEYELLAKQLSFYETLFHSRYDAGLSIAIRQRGGYSDSDGFFSRMLAFMRERLPDIPITVEEPDFDNVYYKGMNFKIFMTAGNEKIEIGDGGFVDWTQKMLGNKKERCLISGIGIDRLLMM